MHRFHFTTVVSNSYLYKFLMLNESLEKKCSSYHLVALCVDDIVYEVLKRMPFINTTVLTLKDLEDDHLLMAKNNRSKLEYCWTLKPFILNYVMSRYKDTEYFAHLDADLFFYSSPEEIIQEAPAASLFLTDHNNSDRFMHTYGTSGRFNTGFVGCKNNEIAAAAIDWWKMRCLEKCVSTPNVEEKLFGDQRYTEMWPLLFEQNVHVVQTKGANVAQWNIEKYHVHENNGRLFVDERQLIFYHFSGLSIISEKEFNLTYFYQVAANPLNYIYLPYVHGLSNYIRYINEIYPSFKEGFLDKKNVPNIHYIVI